jgi:hypothetical protein
MMKNDDLRRHDFHGTAGKESLPHSLVESHKALTVVLDKATSVYNRTGRASNSASVLDAIERFVHEFYLQPIWFKELENRAILVEKACAIGSKYSTARTTSLSSFSSEQSLSIRGKCAVALLHRSVTDCPIFLAEVTRVRKEVEAILNEKSRGLKLTAVRAFSDWRDACIAVQHKAEWLEVDGCFHLYHVYLTSKSRSSDLSKSSRAILQTQMAGALFESLRAAADSLLRWTTENVPTRSDATIPNLQPLLSSSSSMAQASETRKFERGEMVFFEDRVVLCGVDICSGPRSQSRRVVLELLSQQKKDGTFAAYSGGELEAEAKRKGANGTAARWIRTCGSTSRNRCGDRRILKPVTEM